MNQERILVVDDEPAVRQMIVNRLQPSGYDVLQAECGRRALELAPSADLVILDYQLPDLDGLAVLSTFKERRFGAIVIFLTGHADVAMAVAAMKLGAYHFAAKPFDLNALVAMIARALETAHLDREIRPLKGRHDQLQPLDQIVGDSPRMLQFKSLLAQASSSPASTVVISGESGTGKGLAARVLHAASARAHRPFVNITCSALPDTLLESELFGHERGAFTDAREHKRGLLEIADGGTVFLDEISEMPLALQAKLLRFLEEKTLRRIGGRVDIEVNARVIAATNRALDDDVRAGRFRQDLFYRLSVIGLEVPPLRERLEDLPALVTLYLEYFNREFKKNVRRASEAALERLAQHRWPGNVRELRNVIERAMLFVRSDVLESEDLGGSAAGDLGGEGDMAVQDLDLARMERRLILEALERTGWNRTYAAQLLGLNRDQIRYRIEKLKLAAK
jgi:DNA-binding NtrC family response regulator